MLRPSARHSISWPQFFPKWDILHNHQSVTSGQRRISEHKEQEYSFVPRCRRKSAILVALVKDVKKTPRQRRFNRYCQSLFRHSDLIIDSTKNPSIFRFRDNQDPLLSLHHHKTTMCRVFGNHYSKCNCTQITGLILPCPAGFSSPRMSCESNENEIVSIFGNDTPLRSYCRSCFNRMDHTIRNYYEQMRKEIVSEGVAMKWQTMEVQKACDNSRKAEREELRALEERCEIVRF